MQECDLELINEAVYEYISQYVDPQDILKNEPMSRQTQEYDNQRNRVQ